MIVQGFNSELEIARERYHVQTESVGENLVTLIFQNGAVIARAKQRLTRDINSMELQDIRRMMQEQHSLMLNKLKNGELIPISSAEARRSRSAPRLPCVGAWRKWRSGQESPLVRIYSTCCKARLMKRKGASDGFDSTRPERTEEDSVQD